MPLPTSVVQVIEVIARVVTRAILEEIRRPVVLEDAKPLDAATQAGLDAELADAVAAGKVPPNDA